MAAPFMNKTVSVSRFKKGAQTKCVLLYIYVCLNKKSGNFY